MSDTVTCVRCGKDGPKLDWPPYSGEAGEQLVSSVCKDCWPQWLELQTKIINEYRLQVLDPNHQRMVAEQCLIFFGLKEGPSAETGTPPEEKA
jgi:Fe-S cluster biosynthesis and repair protein YggX